MDTSRTLVIVEDDAAFATTLKRSFERRGYAVDVAAGPDELDAILKARSPGFAVVDLKLAGASGLQCVEALHAHDPSTVIVVLTGFASIATGGRGDQARGAALSREAVELGRHRGSFRQGWGRQRRGADRAADFDQDGRVGAHSSDSWSRRISTSRKRRGGLGCIGGRSRESSRNGK